MKPRQVLSACCGVCLAILIAGAGCSRPRPDPKDCNTVDRPAATEPNYAQATLPPNIAPINFVIREKGTAYYVHIRSQAGNPIDVFSRSGTVDIPISAWRELLKANANQVLYTDVYVRDDRGRWTRFAPMENRIAPDPIDPYVAYRIIPPLFMYYGEMGLYQRDLTSFSERPILLNRSLTDSCINCHSFQDRNPNRMFFHVRAGGVGTSLILAYDGRVEKVDTKTAFNGPTSYRSWHPNGHTVGFAFNTVRQVFHATGSNFDVLDTASDLLVYDVVAKTVTTSPRISDPNRMETYPEWSPDGKYIYFCSGPSMESVSNHDLPYRYMKYDLMRISYDVDKDVWGEAEPVIKAARWTRASPIPRSPPTGDTSSSACRTARISRCTGRSRIYTCWTCRPVNSAKRRTSTATGRSPTIAGPATAGGWSSAASGRTARALICTSATSTARDISASPSCCRSRTRSTRPRA